MSTIADFLVGGWSLEGITRLESGPPVLVRVGQDLANIGRSYLRPNLVGDPNDGPKDIDNWFNADAFEIPAPYTFGTAAPFIINADGIVSYDIAIQKRFPVKERHSIEFRAEMFNFPNHPNWNNPDTNPRSATFGKITSKTTDVRNIQLSLRYSF